MLSSRKLKRFYRRNSESAATMDQIPLRARAVLKASEAIGGRCRSMETRALSKVAEPLATVAPSEDFTVVPPRKHGEQRDEIFGTLGERRAWVLQDAIAAGCSSTFLVGNKAVIPDYYARQSDMVVSDGRLLIWHGRDQKAIVCQEGTPTEYASGISLFGAGTFNWYHWLIEQLPAAFLAESINDELNNAPFVIPEEIAKLPTFRDSLALFSGARDVVSIGQKACSFGNLYVFDSAIEEPFNMADGRWPEPTDYRFAPNLMRSYRDEIVKRLEIEDHAPQRRIYLARRHGRRAYNQEAVLATAQRYGVEPVYPEEMTFAEQVQLMRDAAVVVGPSGAAFANTLFCQPGTQLLSWLIPEYRGFCSYANLATITGSEIRYLFPPAREPVGSTRAAFSATYDVNIAEFEEALRTTVDNIGEKTNGSVAG